MYIQEEVGIYIHQTFKTKGLTLTLDCHSSREEQTKYNITLHHHPTVAGEIIDKVRTAKSFGIEILIDPPITK